MYASSSTLYVALSATAALLALYELYSKITSNVIDFVPGPSTDSWLYGNLPKILRGEAAVNEAIWHKQYGKIVRLKGPLGQNMLLVSDPKALQYIYQTRSYCFPKPPERIAITSNLFGKGLLTVEGDVHKRQRRVMLPAFNTGESRAFVPIFMHYAAQMVNKWQELIDSSDSDSVVINLPHWTSRATLDAIGEAAFGYKFSSLENSDDELSTAFQRVVMDSFGSPSNVAILFVSLMRMVPEKVANWLYDLSRNERIKSIKRTGKLSKQVAKELVDEKSRALLEGVGDKDILSLCVKANTEQNSRGKLTEQEMLSQLQTIAFAGHETTSSAITWTFYELAKRPDVQDRLRAEVLHKQQEKRARGDTAWSWKDFEETPYLTAVMKEVLRFHPLLPLMYRVAVDDDVLPLSEPITTTKGEVIHELPIPKGLRLTISVASYNRDPTIFGADADEFNPERWISRGGKGQFEYRSMGVISNLLTFGAGPRSCIGWRFAVLELQCFIVEMVSKFRFSHAVDPSHIRREASAIMAPILDGQVENGSQLLLQVTRLEV